MRWKKAQPAARPPRLAAPWYVHPLENPQAWQKLLLGSDLSFAVVNAANGPNPYDPVYDALLRKPFATPLLGYVNVDYGRRSRSEVVEDCEQWLTYDSVNGIMFDCVPPTKQGNWSLKLIDRARDLGASTVAANPGLPPDLKLMAAADVICVGEYSWATFQRWDKPGYLNRAPAEKQWILVHDVPSSEQGRALQRITDQAVGLGWVTAGTLPNPWRVLPEAW